MKPKTYLLVTAGFVTVTMIAASSLQAASQQLFHNQTARVGMITTMKLLNFRPHPVSQTASIAPLTTISSPSVTLVQSPVALAENRRFSLHHSLNQVEQMTDALMTLKKLSANSQLISSQPMTFVLTDAQLQTTQGLNWMPPTAGPLQPQAEHMQIQKLNLELPQVQNAREAK
jgi:hypothetical protein